MNAKSSHPATSLSRGAVLFFEYVILLLLSVISTSIISNLKRLDVSSNCDIGAIKTVPYVAYNIEKYCALPKSAAIYTGIYFLIGLVVIAVSHLLYRRGRTKNHCETPYRTKIAPVLGFWTVFIVWVFGLEGSRGSAEGLTQYGYGLYLWLCLLLATSHFLIMYFRYRDRAGTSDPF